MELYVSEFSKYVITLLITLYTYECFAVFRYDNEEARNGIYIRQNIFNVCISLFAAFWSSALKREILPICFFMRSSRFCCLRLLCCTA